MGFTVQDMLDMKLFQKANLLWGKGGIGAGNPWCYDY